MVVKAKLLLSRIKLVILDALLVLIYALRSVTVQYVSYIVCVKTRNGYELAQNKVQDFFDNDNSFFLSAD